MSPKNSTLQPDGPSAVAIRLELDRLSSDAGLKLSNRNRRFLAFVVNETLEGRGDRIKAYAIGVDVFGRGEDFDPTVDPIVRIEATRIRTALAAYYLGPGSGDAIRITIPAGSYIPSFGCGHYTAAPTAVAAETAQPSIASSPVPSATAFFVTHLSDQRDRCAASRGELLIAAVVQRLSAAGCDVFVMTPAQRRSPKKTLKPFLDASRSVYAVDVTVHTLVEAKRYDWRLTDLWNRRVGWSESSDHPDDGHPSAETIDGLASRIVRTVFSAAR